MAWRDSAQIRNALETAFKHIQQTRMQDVPVLNLLVSVQALDFKRYQHDWLGVLITPWFMNLLLLPEPDSSWQTQATGSKFNQTFPYGMFEFTVAHESQIGVYALCSLFSPMLQFDSHAAAVEAGLAVMQSILTSPAPRTLSRRDLLRGKLGTETGAKQATLT